MENKTHGNFTYSNLNEGYGKVLRYGAYSEEVIQKLRWMEDVMAPLLKKGLESSEGIDIRALLAESLHMGDEGHNRNKAGSILFTAKLAPLLTRVAEDQNQAAEVLAFLGDNALSVLNPVMAACKAMSDASHGIEGSTIVSVMARNGTDFGIRISGLGERWFTAPVPTPKGLYFPGFTEDDSSGDIGDSTITESAGIGGFVFYKYADDVDVDQLIYDTWLNEKRDLFAKLGELAAPVDEKGNPMRDDYITRSGGGQLKWQTTLFEAEGMEAELRVMDLAEIVQARLAASRQGLGS